MRDRELSPREIRLFVVLAVTIAWAACSSPAEAAVLPPAGELAIAAAATLRDELPDEVAGVTQSEPQILWRPNVGPQTQFLASTANEVLFGGSAGGGKSAATIASPIRWIDHKAFRALILRRDTTQLGDLHAKASLLYPHLGGRSKRVGESIFWTFPSGAQFWFTHCQHEKDVRRFDGQEFQLVNFDELTHFTETQYRKIRARIRTPHTNLPRYTRSTTNPPEDAAGEWVFRRWAAWLDPEAKIEGLPRREGAPAALPGQVLWFLKAEDDSDTERVVPAGTRYALSRTFIPASLKDNPFIGDDYVAQLRDLDPVRRAQLLSGDWLKRPDAGEYFKRGWFEIVDAKPARVLSRIRYWDRAATKPNPDNKDPDWTRGLKLSSTPEGAFYVEDLVSLRDRPATVKATIRQTAQLDGRGVLIGLEQDPGQAGVAEVEDYVKALVGYPLATPKPTGDKVTRARPVSAQAEHGNIKLVRGEWNEVFLKELEAFPKGAHDDIVDALSGAFAEIADAAAARFRALAQR